MRAFSSCVIRTRKGRRTKTALWKIIIFDALRPPKKRAVNAVTATCRRAPAASADPVAATDVADRSLGAVNSDVLSKRDIDR